MQHHRRAGGAGHVLQAHGDAQPLHQGDEHREITGILGDLAPPGLPLLTRHALDVRAHHLQKLHDDGRRNVRHDAQREHRDVGKAAAGEHVEKAEKRPGHALEKRGQSGRVHAGDRHMNADPVTAQDEEGPAQALRQGRLARHRIRRSCCHARLVAFARPRRAQLEQSSSGLLQDHEKVHPLTRPTKRGPRRKAPDRTRRASASQPKGL